MSGTRTYDCFLCGKPFTISDSLGANTREVMSKTYCSRICEDLDSERIDNEIKEEQARLAEYDNSRNEEVIKAVTSGGFTLKVKP